MRRDSSETKRKILTVCVRLFLEQGYKNTTVSQIVDEAGVARGSYLNLFPTKDRILLELTETMFGGQFGVARSIADSKLPAGLRLCGGNGDPDDADGAERKPAGNLH